MHDQAPLRPPRLYEGARVALVAPAGPVSDERLDIALDRCRRFGLHAVPGRSTRAQHAGYLAGRDDDRLADLRWALADESIDAIWALRGGYGTMRLLAQLDLAPLQRRPRAYIGFSDNTAVHLAIRARGVVSFHAPHAGGDASPLAEDCLRRVLFRAEPAGTLPLPPDSPPHTLVSGAPVDAPLVGGNLALLAAMCGTPAPPVAAGCILFIEDIGEAAYRLDRAWLQLQLSGSLEGVAGIAFGRFSDCGDDDELHELLYRLAGPLGVPVIAGLPIGHEPDNWTLPLGVRARLDVAHGTLELLEPAVS